MKWEKMRRACACTTATPSSRVMTTRIVVGMVWTGKKIEVIRRVVLPFRSQ